MNPLEYEITERQVFDLSPIAMAVLDIETGCSIDCNKAMLDILHLKSNADVLGITPLAFSATVQYDDTLSQESYASHAEYILTEDTSSFEWTTASCSVAGASGIHDLYLKFTDGSSASMSQDSCETVRPSTKQSLCIENSKGTNPTSTPAAPMSVSGTWR